MTERSPFGPRELEAARAAFGYERFRGHEAKLELATPIERKAR